MKKKLTAVALIVALLAVAVVGATLAYFTDTTDEVTNTFTMSSDDAVKITLDEAKVKYDETTHTWIVDETAEKRVTENTYDDIYPGAELPKDPTIHNEGDYDAYVRMDVTLTKAAEWTALFNEYELDMDDIFPDYEDQWARYAETLDAEADTLTYSYIWSGDEGPQVVAPTASTLPIFETVVIPVELDAADMATVEGFQITAFGFAIQADGAEVDTLIEELKAMEKPEAPAAE